MDLSGKYSEKVISAVDGLGFSGETVKTRYGKFNTNYTVTVKKSGNGLFGKLSSKKATIVDKDSFDEQGKYTGTKITTKVNGEETEIKSYFSETRRDIYDKRHGLQEHNQEIIDNKRARGRSIAGTSSYTFGKVDKCHSDLKRVKESEICEALGIEVDWSDNINCIKSDYEPHKKRENTVPIEEQSHTDTETIIEAIDDHLRKSDEARRLREKLEKNHGS